MHKRTGAKRTSGQTTTRKGARWPWIVIIVLAGLAAIAFVYRAPITGYSGAGAAYSAHVACSCRFIGNRDLEDCAKDKLAGMELVRLSEDIEAKSVTARYPLIASETATYRKGYGCVLQKW